MAAAEYAFMGKKMGKYRLKAVYDKTIIYMEIHNTN